MSRTAIRENAALAGHLLMAGTGSCSYRAGTTFMRRTVTAFGVRRSAGVHRSRSGCARDPVQALKAVPASGRGGYFTELATLLEDSSERDERRREAVFKLDAKGGVQALDVTATQVSTGASA